MSLAAAEARRLPKTTWGDSSVSWWALWIVIATESCLFGALLFSYYYLALGNASWPPAGVELPELGLPAAAMAVLVFSCLPTAWAQLAAGRGQQTQLTLALGAAFGMGVVFVVLQLAELSTKSFRPQSSAYGSIFFTTLGMHDLHVAVGLLISMVVQARAWLGHFSARRHAAVENLALYWYFLAALGVAIFLLLEVAPHVSRG